LHEENRFGHGEEILKRKRGYNIVEREKLEIKGDR
jgi:hypothetical protein